MNKAPIALLLSLALLVGILGVGYFVWDTRETVVQQSEGDAIVPPGVDIDWRIVCGDDVVGNFFFSQENPLNSSVTEYESNTVRFYTLLDDGTEKFLKSVSGCATGYANTSLTCGKKFVAYVQSASGTASMRETFLMDEEDVTEEWNVAETAGLIFRAYDNDEASWVYANDSATSSEWSATGTTFRTTTSNSTDKTVGGDGYIDYKIEFKTNGTAATDKQFQDLGVIFGVNNGNTTAWAEPAGITFSGTGRTAVKEACGSKITGDGYDYCYRLLKDGKVPKIEDSTLSIRYEQHSQGGVDPGDGDDITVALFVEGRFKETFGSAMKTGTNRDDSSKTYVRTAQTAVIGIA